MRMNIQTMLLPHKHIRFSNSLVAIAGYIRTIIEEPLSIDELWLKVEQKKATELIKPSFTQFIFAIDILFCIKQIVVDEEGRINLTARIDNKL
ncbi:ABC-three component system middle component 6 [Yersinia rohdei]|uniref:ABC-three component system middle component 6 n=2 Tax=Enterobacterales TaxID=91347 RepID=UPI0011A19A6A